jgi:hypothetical protein
MAMKWRTVVLLLHAWLVAGIGSIWAEVYNEAGDAGQLQQSAQEVAMSGPIDAIQGRIGNAFDVDLFRIGIDDPSIFSARISAAGTQLPDPQLFLFDDRGLGVVASDDWLYSPMPQIPWGTLRGYAPGTYLLGVSPADADPWGALGEIFPDVASGLSHPSGLSRFDRLLSWSHDYMATGGTYNIELSGAVGVPEPSTYVLLAVAALGLAFYGRRRGRG